MTLTIVPNTFCIERCSTKKFQITQNKIVFNFSFYITSLHIVFTAKVTPIGKLLSIDFGADLYKPFIIFEFIHNPLKFECAISEKDIKIFPKTLFSPLLNPKTIVRARIDRELASGTSSTTAKRIKHLILKTYWEKEKPLDSDELEVIPLLNHVKVEAFKPVFFRLKRFDACTAFVKKLIYDLKDPIFEEMVEVHFKTHASTENTIRIEYTTTCLEYFILKKKPIPWHFVRKSNCNDAENTFALKYLTLITTSPNALEIVKAKYSYVTDISTYPVWLQVHFLKEYLAAPGIIEEEKNSCLFQLLTIYLDLEMEQSDNVIKFRKLAYVRAMLPKRKRFISEESVQLSEWILNVIQNLHNNDYWNSSLRQKVVEISDALELGWKFPDTFREAYYPALFYESKKEALPYHLIVDELSDYVLTNPQSETNFYYSINALFSDQIVPTKDVFEFFLNSSFKFLILKGERGTGKTSSIYKFANDALMEYGDSETYIPYIHLDQNKNHPDLLDKFQPKEALSSIPFVFIFEDVNALKDVPYVSEWKELYPNAKFIFTSRNSLPLDEEHLTCTLLPLRQDEHLSFFEICIKEYKIRYSGETLVKALSHLTHPTPFHMQLLTKLLSRSMHPDTPHFHEKINQAIQCLEIEWDKSKGITDVNTKPSSSLQPIIKWFRKLNQSISDR